MPLLLGALIVIGIAFDMVTRSRAVGDDGAHVRGGVRRHAAGPVGAHARHRAGGEEPVQLPRSQLREVRVPLLRPRRQAAPPARAGQRARHRLRLRGRRQRHLPAHQRARRRLARRDRHLPPHRRHPRGVQARRGQAAHRARRARRLRAGADRPHARGGRSAARRRHPQGEPEADRPPLQDRQERGAAPGERRRGARLSARRHAGGLGRQGGEPLRSRSGAGVGPRRLRHRRAPRRGELGQPGAGGVVQVARPRAGRRLPRRLQGARRAERGGRHRPAHRVHAQEAAHPARADRGGAGRARRPPTARGSRRRSGRGPCRCSTSAASSSAPRRRTASSSITSTAGSSRSTIGASPSSRIAPRRAPSASSGGSGCSGRPAGASGRPRRWGPTSTICWRASAIRSACRSCTPSTTGRRWPTPARPTSGGTAGTCRARSPATSRWRAIWPPTCSTPSTGSRRRAIRPPRRRPSPARRRRPGPPRCRAVARRRRRSRFASVGPPPHASRSRGGQL